MQSKILLTGDIGKLAGDIIAYDRRRALTVTILMILGGFLEGVGLAFLVPLFAVITTPITGGSGHIARIFASLGASTPLEQLALVIGIFLLIMVARAAVQTARDFNMGTLQFTYIEHLQVRLVRALGASHWQDVESLRHARITQALGGDMGRVASAAQLLLQVTVAAFMVLAQWLVAMVFAPKVALLALAVAVAGAAAFRQALNRSANIGKIMSGGGLSMMNTTAQLLGGLKLSIAQNMQPAFVQEFETVAREICDRRQGYQRRQSLVKSGITLAAAVAGAAILLIGFWWRTPIANLLAAFLIFSRIAAAATSFVQSSQQLASSAPAFGEVKSLLNELEERVSPQPAGAEPISAPSSGSLIVYDKVTYGDSAQPRLGGVELTIGRGEVIGVTGPSGSGKTTFVDLLTGLVTANSGVVRIDGAALNRATASAWRDRIAYVTQDSYLINDTIRQNLAWGAKALSEDEIWAALAMAGVEPLIRQTEKGLDTVVSERGARFSGGERQRIALARALLRRPEVLILDEATNAIDIETEKMIFHRLTSQEPRATIIVVAHRPSTLAICDRVLTFEAGRLVLDERGAEAGGQ